MAHGLCFVVVILSLPLSISLSLCCTERTNANIFPPGKRMGKRMSFSVANDLYSVFNGLSKSIK